MQLDIKTLSIYRLNRAKEDLEAAISNHQAGFYKVSINREVSGSCRICRKSVEPRGTEPPWLNCYPCFSERVCDHE